MLNDLGIPDDIQNRGFQGGILRGLWGVLQEVFKRVFNWDMDGDLKGDLVGDLEVNWTGDYGGFAVKLRFSLELKFNSLELDSEV